MRSTIRTTAVAILTLASAQAQSPAPDMIATTTCGSFAQRYRDAPDVTEKAFFSWAQAFMDGLNSGAMVKGGPRDISSMPADDQKRSLRQYCEEHPKANFLASVMALYRQLPVRPR